MESFNSRFKDEGQSLFVEAQTLSQLITVVDERMWYHNHERRHSSVSQLSAITVIESNWPAGPIPQPWRVEPGAPGRPSPGRRHPIAGAASAQHRGLRTPGSACLPPLGSIRLPDHVLRHSFKELLR